ncbi:sensor histidine kinase [Microbacterium rhizosphaerae]|uniref:Sensor-like histidine kinase SenX3 n=1 Tax=Microbacterium rhizosphaerae TaxID=1678237 RepID=A0ABZ0SKZ4_9MICO|nr:ATP-binding protein [Microbacterium rhizosphaerae]WPR88849.1 ATP-binding protein [Microbacterium rhizosphaerae]
MESTQLTLLALVTGLLVGGGIVAAIVALLRARDRARAQISQLVPEGAREIIAAMDDAAALVDASGTVRASSPATQEFGVTEAALLPSDELRALAREARDTHLAVTGTLRLRRGNALGEARLVAVRMMEISPKLVLAVLRDITERERVAEMRRDFVANTSHELKTPVGAVSLLAEAIESAADDPEQVRIFASRLTAEASRLGLLTSRIMNLSRLQASDDLTDARDLAVDEVVASAVEAHAVQAASAGVDVHRGGERGLYVRGDAQVLIEAVGNLIANAIAYSSHGSTVGVGVRAVDDIVEIAVTDRGIGIAEADQQRVFERFYRADQARSRRTGGTGLGLSIVKYAAQRHGGEVVLWSRPGRGSTFTIRLPRIDAPDADGTHRKRGKSAKAKPTTKIKSPSKAKAAAEKPRPTADSTTAKGDTA